MRRVDENALICDFAEVYGVLDYRSLPPLTAAALARGLGENSRIMRALRGVNASTNDLLLAIVADRLGTLIWMLSEDGKNGENRPASIFDAMAGKKQESELMGYQSGADFDAAWKRLTGGD